MNEIIKGTFIILLVFLLVPFILITNILSFLQYVGGRDNLFNKPWYVKVIEFIEQPTRSGE